MDYEEIRIHLKGAGFLPRTWTLECHLWRQKDGGTFTKNIMKIEQNIVEMKMIDTLQIEYMLVRWK